MCIFVMPLSCVEKRKPQSPPPLNYALPELISRIEQNTNNLQRFRSKGGRLMSKIPTDKGIKRFDLDGVVILFEKPKRLYLSGSYLGSPALQIGSNDQTYWLGVLKDPQQLHWGYWKNADLECNTWRMGIPLKLMEALGQIDIRDVQKKFSGPVVMQRRENANVLMYNSVDSAGSGYIAKEIYITQYEPILITKIIYYKPDGSHEMTIDYSNYKPVINGCMMATKVILNCPSEECIMSITLGKITPVDTLPEGAFATPNTSDFETVEQVDIDCK